MTPARLFVSLLATAALAACGGETKTGPERKTAAGEVLGGTITDEMLPLDTVRSQSPPLREGAGASDGETAEDDGRPTPPARASSGRADQADRADSEAAPAPVPRPVETPEEVPE